MDIDDIIPLQITLNPITDEPIDPDYVLHYGVIALVERYRNTAGPHKAHELLAKLLADNQLLMEQERECVE